jgi:DMSO/TMAO reductase YedYZ molybdopterin-dependent catalytic subunit
MNAKHGLIAAIIAPLLAGAFACGGDVSGPALTVKGEVKSEITLDRKSLSGMDAFLVKDVPVMKEKTAEGANDEVVSVSTFKGVLLRDILYRAGMKHTRKWEPGTFIRVTGSDGRQTVFSFGELFYSSTGRSVLVALERDNNAAGCDKGPGDLVAANDLRDGRMIPCVARIEVGRVDVEMHAYADRKKNVKRPPKSSFDLVDRKASSSKTYTARDLEALPALTFNSAILIGECSGFKGIHSFRGVSLRAILESQGYGKFPRDYSRYVLATSEDGFCSVFSFGEIFNSRLDDNIMIATSKNGKSLGEEGFAMSVVREDSTGGRSVKRIFKMEIF